jgi:hypothetical protein
MTGLKRVVLIVAGVALVPASWAVMIIGLWVFGRLDVLQWNDLLAIAGLLLVYLLAGCVAILAEAVLDRALDDDSPAQIDNAAPARRRWRTRPDGERVLALLPGGVLLVSTPDQGAARPRRSR